MGDDGVQPSAAEWDRIAGRWGWTPREQQVARLMVEGKARKEAAHVLAVSVSTLQMHFRRALRKADAKGLVSLVWNIVNERDVLRRPNNDKRLATR